MVDGRAAIFRRRLQRVATLRARLKDDVNAVDEIRRPRGLSTREYERAIRLLRVAEAKLAESARAYFGPIYEEQQK